MSPFLMTITTPARSGSPTPNLYERSLERMLATARHSRIGPEPLMRLRAPRTIV
jgi:hypothetical protein